MTAARLIRIAPTITRRIATGLTFLLTVILTMIATPSLAQSGLSGTYVSASPRSAEMIFIVQTPDGRLTGRLESATLNRTGVVSRSSATLEGAADGTSVVLTPRSILLSLGSPPSFSGVLDGDDLNLSWQGGHGVFRRGTAEQFRAAVAGLETRATQVKALIAFDEAMTRHAGLTRIADDIEAKTPDLRERLTDASERYRELFPRFHSRRRGRLALNYMQSRGFATGQEGPDEQSTASEIDALGQEVINLRLEMRDRFESARTLAASIDTYCADTPDAAQTPPCSGATAQRVRLDRLRTVVQSEFDAAEAAYHEASGGAGAARRITQNLARP